MESIEFELTQEDINNGVRAERAVCPFALAIRRAMPDTSVLVSSVSVCVYGSGYYRIYHNTDVMKYAIRDYDNKGVLPTPGPYVIEMTKEMEWIEKDDK